MPQPVTLCGVYLILERAVIPAGLSPRTPTEGSHGSLNLKSYAGPNSQRSLYIAAENCR